MTLVYARCLRACEAILRRIAHQLESLADYYKSISSDDIERESDTLENLLMRKTLAIMDIQNEWYIAFCASWAEEVLQSTLVAFQFGTMIKCIWRSGKPCNNLIISSI